MSKYENGYLPKIEYWLDKVVEGRTKAGREHAKSKVLYFVQRQVEVYSREEEQLRAYGGQLRGDALLKAIGFVKK